MSSYLFYTINLCTFHIEIIWFLYNYLKPIKPKCVFMLYEFVLLMYGDKVYKDIKDMILQITKKIILRKHQKHHMLSSGWNIYPLVKFDIHSLNLAKHTLWKKNLWNKLYMHYATLGEVRILAWDNTNQCRSNVSQLRNLIGSSIFWDIISLNGICSWRFPWKWITVDAC